MVSRDVGKRIRHILNPDSVYNGTKVKAEAVSVLGRGDLFEDDIIRIKALPSTDIGNCYLVTNQDINIFHAGDLNAWIWLDESTDAEVRKSMGDYKACLRDIEDFMKENKIQVLDYCFFPVDSRIGRDFSRGALIFVRQFDVKRFFPMHFDLGDSLERSLRLRDAINFNNYANFERGEYIPLVIHGSYYISE